LVVKLSLPRDLYYYHNYGQTFCLIPIIILLMSSLSLSLSLSRLFLFALGAYNYLIVLLMIRSCLVIAIYTTTLLTLLELLHFHLKTHQVTSICSGLDKLLLLLLV